jgi:phage-related protein
MASPQNSVLEELYKYNPSSIVELFEFELSPLQSYYTNLSPSVYRFHNGYNENYGTASPNIEWNSAKYTGRPIQMEGVQFSSSGEIPRPTLTVANHDLAFTQLNKAYANLVGARVRRIRTFVKFLDSANFKTRNLLINTEAFDTWTQSSAADTDVAINAAIAPNGTLTADKIYEATGASASHALVKAVTTAPDNTSICFSVYLKKGERQYAVLTASSRAGVGQSGKTFDLVNGTVSSITRVAGPPVLSSGIQNVGNDWYRCWIVCSTLSGSPDRNPQYSIFVDSDLDPTVLTYAGVSPTNGNTITSGLYVWGAQAEVVSNPTLTPTTYQAVGAAAGNPTADPNAKFPDDVYTIDRMAEEIPGQVTYELAPAWDVEGVQLPRRQVVANICPWVYKADPCNWTVNGAATVNTPGGNAAAAGTYTAVSVSGGTGTGAKLNVVTTGAGFYSTVATITVANPGTGYTASNTLTVLGSALGGTDGTNNLTVNIDTLTGAKFFDQNDSEVATSAEDRCGKRLTSCKLRFGTRALPFGGFPSAGLYGKPI